MRISWSAGIAERSLQYRIGGRGPLRKDEEHPAAEEAEGKARLGVNEAVRFDFRLDDGAAEEGLAFVRSLCERFDCSRLAYLKVAPGSGGGRVYGVCRYPDKAGKTALTRKFYRISCFVQGPFPDGISVRRPPVYRNEDGSWPRLPVDERIYTTGGVETGPPPAKAWMRITSITDLDNASEAAVWIVAHEMFHYLRATRQIPGRNTEIEADALADQILREFRGLR